MMLDFSRADDRFFTLISGDWSSMIRESILSSWDFNPLRGWVKIISLPTLAFPSIETEIPMSWKRAAKPSISLSSWPNLW
jgi:hypothetical protein